MHESGLSYSSPDTASPNTAFADTALAGTPVLRDQAGIAAAVLCAVHCALLPLAAGWLAAIGFGVMLDERVELALLMLAATIGVWSLWPSFRHRHGRLLPLSLFATGLLVMSSARLFEDLPALEMPMVIAGAAAVAVAHVVNLWWCRRCTVCVAP